MRIAVVTDGTCDLPPELAEANHIEIVPHHIHWGPEDYTHGLNTSGKAFYERLAHAPVLPKTAQPSRAEFAAEFRIPREKRKADAVLRITTSHLITGAHGSAL